MTKLTEQQVNEILKLRETEYATDVAKKYGVSLSLISLIWAGKRRNKGGNNMAGTLEGGAKAAQTNKKLYGDDYYAKIGAKGGRLGHTGGFAANRDLAREAGKIGGRISRRPKKVQE